MREVDIFVGVPCSGKTSYRNKNYDKKKTFIVSRDDLRENLMKKFNFDYKDLFAKPSKEDPFIHEKFGVKTPEDTWSNVDRINEQLISDFESRKMEAILQLQQGKKIVFDLTNMTKKERKEITKIFDGIENVSFNALVFEFKENMNLIKSQNKIRGKQDGKEIPDFVIDKMAASFEDVEKDENMSCTVIDGLSGLKNTQNKAIKKQRKIKM